MAPQPTMWARAVLSLLLLATVATAEVVPLTNATFAAHVNSGSVWFVDFYVDWCPWSQRLAPAWEQLGSDEEVRQAGVRVGAVDCDASKATCVNARVMGYPSMKVFHHGEVLEDYFGARELKCLKAFALGLPTVPVALDAAVPPSLYSANEEGLLHDSRIPVGMIPRLLLKLFGL